MHHHIVNLSFPAGINPYCAYALAALRELSAAGVPSVFALNRE